MDTPLGPKQGTPFAFVALFTGCFLWGSALSVVKIALQEYDPVFLVFARMAIAFLILTPVVLVKFRHVRLYRKFDLFLLLLLSCCDPIGFFFFEAMALQYTSASQAGIMWALGPMLNLGAAWLILRERTTLPVIICIIVAMGGVIVLTASGGVSEHASNPILGNFFEFLSLCGAATFVIILRFLRGRYPALFVVWVQSLIATLVFLPTLAFDSVQLPTAFNLEPFLVLFYLAACVSLGAQVCSAYAMARIPVPRAAAFGNLIPIIGVLSGIIVLGERLEIVQWLACGVVLGAVLVSQYFQKKSDAPSEASIGIQSSEQAS